MSDLIYLYIYQHRESGKSYIGVTKEPKRRFHKHAVGKSAARAFNYAVKKYGIESFEHRILAVFDDVDAANYHENAAIAAFGTLSPNGYNLVGGAPGSKYFGPHSEETREKIGASQRGKIISEEALSNLRNVMSNPDIRKKMSMAMKGKKPARVTIERLKEKLSGVPLSEEHRANISKGLNKPETLARIADANRRRIVSEETREKMSKARKGKPRSPEHCKNLSKALNGNVLSSATKEKISKSHKGKTLSIEHKRKIAAALRNYWEQRKENNNV